MNIMFAAGVEAAGDIKTASYIVCVIAAIVLLLLRGLLGVIVAGVIAAVLTAAWVSNVDEPERWEQIGAPVHSLLIFGVVIGALVAFKFCPPRSD
jgi:membrane associated rhomboid family serine protease